MTDTADTADAGELRRAVAVPEARVRRRRWAFSVVWVVPVVAAAVAGYLVYDRMQQGGRASPSPSPTGWA